MNTTSVKPAAEIEKGLFHTPFWLAPEKNVFANRSTRFKELADAEHSGWRDYLNLLAAVCAAQQAVADSRDVAAPGRGQGGTVLPEAGQGAVPSEFFAVFTALLDEVKGKIPAAAARETERLKALSRPDAEALAGRVLTAAVHTEERAAEIWVQAALQIIWTAWAGRLNENDVPLTEAETRTHCPCCGSEAVGSVVLIRSDLNGFRYMHCPLCNSRWNVLRAKCPTCGDAGAMRIQQFEKPDSLPPAYAAANAESCNACRTYRKLYRQDKQQYADPVADDLATLGLDIMVGEAGYERGGANPFLLAEE